ncbi:MAG: GNAT family N-acetyltransferase [Clostridia bacterium]|jgi:N-acetylglutamate synthase-like GNAT family acetyltransferase|nr:GNAT family N-acetyltransferase [Clostridia bacterium]
MLHVKPVIDDSCMVFLRAEGVETSYGEGVDVALYEDERLIGAAHVTFLPDTAVLEGVYVTPDRRGFGLGDFLTRATMDAYTRSLPLFRVAYVSEYFVKFGFKEKDGGMEIASDAIKFPSHCGGHQ